MVAEAGSRVRAALLKRLARRAGGSAKPPSAAKEARTATPDDEVVFLKNRNVVTPEKRRAVKVKNVEEDVAAKDPVPGVAKVIDKEGNVKKKRKRKRSSSKKRRAGEANDAADDSESAEDDDSAGDKEDDVVELDPVTLEPIDGETAKTGRPNTNKAAASNDGGTKEEMRKSGVVYIGHVPLGFEEDEIRSFFEQFGTVLHVHLARSKRTGGPKGYAFIQFKSSAVADIVTETMDGYLMLGRTLQVHVVPEEKVHKGLFVHSGKKRLTPIPHRLAERERLTREDESERIKTKRKVSRSRNARAKERKLSDQGFDYKLDWLYDESASPVSL
ncbi:MKI67 FHA domain-interacting nucleolar phosphoprotein [Porphyridium purpureum]|uniref:MKI67 FHA domain-interacting nucleolar phosphoprotein n=1 Tax=Porphyridium purpureum TaxID=35688 RepID=A0A5J4YWY9_PORPP|nr:MKI67 FHA domain-interacting nucleolar phosphoprotein [Porphyridium purpureum]|eukprot:POR8128..scf209_3